METCRDCGRTFPEGTLVDVFLERDGHVSRRSMCGDCGLLAAQGPLCVHCGKPLAGRSVEIYDHQLGAIRVSCGSCDEQFRDEFHRRVSADERLPNGNFRPIHSLDGYSREQLARAILRTAVCVYCGKPGNVPGGSFIWFAPMNASLIQCGTCLEDIKARPDYTGTRYEQQLIASLPEDNRRNAVLRFK